ncbi:hypothetical protein [Metallibacterium sp.]|uniref:hypothetical protein n=1 Tax=Metallibacterium sp. TaxID=2940281 RepID=UPI00262E1DA9|nr:hypothetical protein [Metallibacterium sp.]
MSNPWNDKRHTLLQALQNIGSSGRAEGAHLDRIGPGYYPVAEHLRLLDPDVVLVVGPRGSGKTEIARVLTDAALFDAVKLYAPAVRLPVGRAEWLRVYPAGTETFEGIGLRTFMNTAVDGTEALRELWFAYLVRALKGHLDEQGRSDVAPLLAPPAANIEAICGAFRELGTKPVVVLDRLDEQLKQQGRYVFATYDELDTLGDGDWMLVEAGVRGLVALWAAYARRWRRIRAKLFLRTDLYERHAKAGGADLAKLAAGRVELVWSDRDLYGQLLKRMANVDVVLADYVQAIKGVSWSKDPSLGQIPKLRTWQDARPVVERMVGIYMGANQKKGLVYRWLLDHVRDGLGRGYPRPFVRLMEEAARLELQAFGTLRSPRLLEPASLRRALDRVSNGHVTDSKDEWPWLDAIKEKLLGNPLVPYTEKAAIKLLEGLLDARDRASPPFEGRELLDYLLELGIFRRRSVDGRLDAPDLYLAGLGLRRKGGVKKKR